MRHSPIVVLLTAIASTTAFAIDPSCIFQHNRSSTAFIDYRYSTADGDGHEMGSGFLVSPEGYLITDAHVVSPRIKDVVVTTQSINVKLGGLSSEGVEASVERIDGEDDLALLKLPPLASGAAWPSVSIAENDELDVGDALMGLGFASSDIAIVPPGIKTAKNTIVDNALKPWWQTNLALNPGDSGGPIFGALGTVVGAAVAINEHAQLVTWVIPISRARHLLDYASVKPAKFANCAIFPECSIPENGIEKYSVDDTQSYTSEERPGGYNQIAFCNDKITSLRQTFPRSTYTIIEHSENSRNVSGIPGVNIPRYTYHCTIRRQEDPIYVKKASEACLP